MSPLHIAILASVQGITEFLPISSSGHLALVPILTGWHDQGLEIDIAVHVGTLGAVVCYFWRDSWSALRGLIRLFGGRSSADTRLAANLIIATIPIIGAGAGVIYFDMTGLWRSAEVIGWSMLGFGILLFIADRIGMTARRVEQMQMGAALAIGIAQIAALIPGTSRSGITITAARLLGFERGESARFSMLLSIPTILAAGSISVYGIMTSPSGTLSSDAVVAAACALAAALLAISLFMAWLRHQNFTPFVVYRILLGAGLLYWVYS
tara:strand:- start:573 stop:1373 length:801 start_codon:yes stop_codon:yes gene_type:complete